MNNTKILYLTENVNNNTILKILTLNNTLDVDAATLSYYEKLAAWADSQKNKITNINLSTIELSDRSLIGNGISGRANSLLGILNALNNKLGNNFNANSETAKKVQQTTFEILKYLKEGPKLYQGMDWTAEKAKRLGNAGGNTSEVLDEFYNDYYKIEYAGLKSPDENDTSGVVDRLKSLDKILIQEFNKLGYSPEVNPLAQFLKILISLQKEGKSNIFSKLTTNTYGAIHNSFIDRKLTGNMLGNYNDKHILFCEDLYSYTGLDIVKYLKLYKETLDKAESTKVEPQQDKWTLAAKIFIQQDLSGPDATSKVQFKDKVKALLEKQGVRIPTANNAKLRSFSEIEELYTYIFKAAPSNEKPKENEVLKAIVAGAKAKNAMLDMVYHIASNEAFKKTYSKTLTDIESQLEKRQYKQSSELTEYSKQVLAPHIKDISIKDLPALVNMLFRAHDSSKKRTQ